MAKPDPIDPDFAPPSPVSDRGVAMLCGTALVLGAMVLVGWIASFNVEMAVILGLGLGVLITITTAMR